MRGEKRPSQTPPNRCQLLGEEVAGSEPMTDLVADWLGRIDADGIAGALKEAVRG